MSDRLPQLIADFKAAGLGHYLRTESDEAALLEGCWVDERRGRYVCDWIEQFCRVSDSDPPGQPFRLIDWQRDRIIMPVFSWVRQDRQGRWKRRIRRVPIFISIRNGKTVFMSAVATYLLLGDGEPASRVFSAANDRKQASIIFGEMANMSKYSPAIAGRVTIHNSDKIIVVDSTSFYRALSADAKTSAGYNAHGIIVDEIALFDEAGRALRDELRGRGDNRVQPLEFIISRAGEDRGIGFEEYCDARAVRDGPRAGGAIDTTVMPVIFEADPKAEITDPKAHAAANPSYGTLLDPDTMMREAVAATKNARLAAQFRMHRLGIWGGRDEQWLDPYRWRSYGTTLEERELLGLPCFGGLDLSLTTDLTAWVLAWKRPDGTLILRPHFWLPLNEIEEREREDRTPYRQYQREGWITLTPGTEIDFSIVASRIADDWKTYTIRQIGFDPWRANMFLPHMRDKYGIGDVDPERKHSRGIVGCDQNTKVLGAATEWLETAINTTGKVVHDGNPIAARHIQWVVPYVDTNGNKRPMKCDKHRRRNRIDFVAAAVNGISRALVCDGKKRGLSITGFSSL